MRLVMAVVAAAGVLSLAACGSNPNSGVRDDSYIVKNIQGTRCIIFHPDGASYGGISCDFKKG